MHIVALLLAFASVLANDRVAVFDGESAGARSHDAVVVDLKTASARFVRQGDPLAANARSIVIELLAPPVGPLPNTTGLPDAFERPGIEKLIENERVTVWRYAWQPGKRTPMHFHARDVVVVFTADGALESITQDGKTVLNPHSFGYTKFSPRGRVHQEELVKGQASAVLVELK